jgi:hypothetical protein
MEGYIDVSFAKGRQDAERDEPPAHAAARAFSWNLMPNNTASCSEAFCGAGNETGSVHECCARHAKLDLCAICHSVEEPDEVCFVSCKAWVRRGGANLRDAYGSASESCEEKTTSEITVAGELDKRLVGVFCRHVGCVLLLQQDEDANFFDGCYR